MTVSPVRPAALVTLCLAGLLLAGCTTSNNASSDGVVSVESGSDSCDLSTTEAPAGTVTFKVKNTGSQATEFYLLAEDGLRIVGEVENIGPGLTRDLVVTVPAGTFVTACKPGMKGNGIRADFTVSP